MPDAEADDTDTVTYQFEMDREAWRTWSRSVPDDTHLHERLAELIENDTPDTFADDTAETVSYRITVGRELWWEWLNSMPREQLIQDRFRTLMEQDMKSSTRGPGVGYSDMEERTARLLSDRIARRAQTATDAIDRDDIESVRDNLSKIQELASTFQE